MIVRLSSLPPNRKILSTIQSNFFLFAYKLKMTVTVFSQTNLAGKCVYKDPKIVPQKCVKHEKF